MKAVSDLLRNTREVKYERSKLRQKTEVDKLASFLDKSRNSTWIQNTQWIPCQRAVVASKGLLEDVVNNYCNQEKFGVFSNDTTYNVGDFYVTSTVYPHIKLESWSTGTGPYLPGPAMLHVKQDESRFVYFGHTLTEKQPRTAFFSLVLIVAKHKFVVLLEYSMFQDSNLVLSTYGTI